MARTTGLPYGWRMRCGRLSGLIAVCGVVSACGAVTAAELPAPGGHRILFVGNSLTYVNDVPGTLAALAAMGGDTISVRSVAKPDFALIDHLGGRSNALSEIARGGWEYVVLQQGSSSLPSSRDSLVAWTTLFDGFIRASGARPALYMVWPTSDRVRFFDDVRLSYQSAAKAVNGMFLPCGAAWVAAWASDSSLQLYSADGLHPTELATYLVALVMYERITGKDATRLPARAVAGGHGLRVSDSTVRVLQRAAHRANTLYAAY